MLLKDAKQPTELKITHLNKRLEIRKNQLKDVAKKPHKPIGFVQKLKSLTVDKKPKLAAKHKDKTKQGRLFVIDFHGDVKASATEQLREEISLIISEADSDHDRVLVRLESPGGMVHGYGLAAAQLARLRDAGIHLTIAIDKVAASGGYMMACIANEIISAPFAIVGSIGVVAQVPNFHRLLEKLDIDFDVYTAGQYKRTVTLFGEKDESGVAKFKDELEQTHKLFKDFVEKYRTKLDVEKVATGEHWYGEDALALNLVDKLQTSDAYLLDNMDNFEIYALILAKKKSPVEKLMGQAAEAGTEKVATKLVDGLHKLSQSATGRGLF